MNLHDKLENTDPDRWIDALEPYQQKTLREIGLGNKSPEMVAKTWLESSTSHTAPFGTSNGPHPFFESIKAEIIGFICNDDVYAGERAKIAKSKNITELFIVGVISQAIAPVVGVSSMFLAPVIAVFLFSLGRISVRALCRSSGATTDSSDN